MLTAPQRAYLAVIVRTMQIVVLAMAAGVTVFGVVTVVVNANAPAGGNRAETLIAYLAAALAGVAIVASIVVPAILANAARQRIITGKPPARTFSFSFPPEIGEIGPLAAAYQTRLIVASAILEGAAFFNLIAYVIAGQTFNLVAAAVMLVALLSLLPTRARLEDWIENQLTIITQLREMQPHDAR